MKKIITILVSGWIVSASIFLIWALVVSYRQTKQESYRAGYEQCAQDTSLYLQNHKGHCGVPQGMRWYLEREKPSPQSAEDMLNLENAYMQIQLTSSNPDERTWAEYNVAFDKAKTFQEKEEAEKILDRLWEGK